MDKLGNGNAKFLFGGWIAGSSCSIPILFAGSHQLLDFVIKFVGLIIAGFITGLFTVLGNDFYKLKVKPRLFKIPKSTDDDGTATKRVA